MTAIDGLSFTMLERVGRLGNQAIQVAATIGLARRYGYRVLLPERWSYRPFFSIPDEMFTPAPGTYHESYLLPDLHHIAPDYRVYMQDVSLWADEADEIRSYFAPSPRAREIMAERLRLPTEPWLCVHVRRGDNVHQQEHYPLPSHRYYTAAAAEHPDMPVVVFGDDFEWNTTVMVPLLADRRVTVIPSITRPKEHEPDYMTAPILDWVDLLAMAQASAFVLSNSTLGVFAAWLAGTDQVTVPTPWYGPALPGIDIDLLLPAGWQRRPNRRNQPARSEH